MTERPILFSAPMVRALLDGRKTQTRRLIKPQPGPDCAEFSAEEMTAAWREGWVPRAKCPYGLPGDRLRVREAYSFGHGYSGVRPRDVPTESFVKVWYWADGNPEEGDWTKPKPGIHMPLYFSRITLDVTDIRVERLNGISDTDAIAEGIEKIEGEGVHAGRFGWKSYETCPNGEPHPHAVVPNRSPRTSFRELWDSINRAKCPWESNPWVWVVEFQRAP